MSKISYRFIFDWLSKISKLSPNIIVSVSLDAYKKDNLSSLFDVTPKCTWLDYLIKFKKFVYFIYKLDCFFLNLKKKIPS